MATKRRAARDVAQDRGRGELWIDHAKVSPEDVTWLAQAERLTLWNVQVPPRFLAQLPRLWWLDLRGGSAPDLTVALGCKKLRYLQVNQVKGLRDLGQLVTFPSLQLLSLYGLPQVERVPSLSKLVSLKRLELGQLRGLASLGGLLDAPKLRELLVHNRVGITADDIAKLNDHPALEQFAWHALDVPAKLSRPVIEGVRLPRANAVHAEAWFEALAKRRR